ncbi:hypothetical protein [Thiomicrorhabdus sp.]|uniref:hypothetical protein n=1 Tax=Thiomicrorhabdus sp. TaxID=2039724 RepID=UPI0029C93E86|nr:hypothetical protein [Thiomicrorhabdus sp.]
MSQQILNALAEINAGVTRERLEVALKEVAIGVANAEKNGEVTLKFKIMPQKNTSGQVNIDATVSFTKPNLKGSTSEVRTDSTPMFVSKFGLSALPEQPGLDFDKSDKVSAIK